MSGRETDHTAASLTQWLASMCLSQSTPTSGSPSSCLFIAEGIHRPSWIVISTIQHMLSNTTCFFVCLPGPVSKNGLYFLAVLSMTLCDQLCAAVRDCCWGGGLWIQDEGEKVTLDLLQKSISVERWAALWRRQALTAPELKCYTCCEAWRLLSFCGANTLNFGSSYLGEIYQLFRFPSSIWGLSIWSVYFKPWCLTSGKMIWCV